MQVIIDGAKSSMVQCCLLSSILVCAALSALYMQFGGCSCAWVDTT